MNTHLTGRGLFTLSLTINLATLIVLYIISYFVLVNPIFIPGTVALVNALGLPLLMWLVVSYFKGGENREG